MAKEMTHGNAWKQIVLFMLPILFGNLFQQAYNMADAAIVGQTLGAVSLGAVGVSSSVQFLVLGFCFGITTGFAIPIATSFGAKRYDDLRRYIFNSTIVLVLLALVVTIATSLSVPLIMRLLRVPQEILKDASLYLLIIFLGIPFLLLYNYLSSILRAVGDSRTPFLFLAFSSVLNVILDFFCILNLHWGVAGAAIATIFSQGVSGFLCLGLIVKKYEILHIHKANRIIDFIQIRHLLNMGIPMGLQFSITAIGSMVMQATNNTLGTIYVSGYVAGSKINNFMMCPFDALAASVCTFISQNLGAKKPDRMYKGLQIGFRLALVWGIVGGLILMVFGKELSLLFVSKENTQILAASSRYLFTDGCFYILLGELAVYRLTTQGLGYSNRAIFAGVAEMIARMIVCLGFVSPFRFTAITLADGTAWIFADAYIIPMCLYSMKEVTRKL